MDGFFSKASSFLNSQADHGSAHDEKPSKPASSAGYDDLLAGAEGLMQKAAKSKEEEKPADAGAGDAPHKAAPTSSGSGGYGDLLASAQSLMGSAKLSDGDQGTQPSHGGKGGAEPGGGGDAAGHRDVMASAQVLIGAAKKSREGGAGGAPDMGEVAGAAADLVDAASRYGKLEKTAYGEYADKAEAYLRDYEASHGSKAGTGKPAGAAAGGNPVQPAAGRRTATDAEEEGKTAQEAAAAPPKLTPLN